MSALSMETIWVEMLFTAIVIMLARVVDVSLGTIRTICVVKNMRPTAMVLGFFECLVWVTAVGKVATNLNQPIYVVAYACGFALGNYSGLVIEKRLAWGNQVLRVFTRRSTELSPILRQRGLRVTKFIGEGNGGSVDLLLLKLPRREIPHVTTQIRDVDPEAFYYVDDIGEASDSQARYFLPAGWETWAKWK